MTIPRTTAVMAVIALALQAGARAQDDAQDPGPEAGPTWSEMLTQLGLESGEVTVEGGKATIDLPEGWHYLQPEGARFIVERIWNNPPDPDTLGLLTPPEFESEDEGSPSWAIIVSYDDEGHVDDGDAAGIDYDDLLATMQEGTEASNEARSAAGYGTIELRGWAERPSYDSASKKLYWAKHLRFTEPTGESGDALNYDVRILGRRGTLVLQAVAGMEELDAVRRGVRAILPAVDFVDGERYGDYQEGVDPLVVGGIGALIGGKLLLKGGFLKILLGLWKPIAIGLAAVGAFLMKLFGGKSKPAPQRRRRAAVATADDAE